MVRQEVELFKAESLYEIISLPRELYSEFDKLLEVGYCLLNSGFILHPNKLRNQAKWAHLRCEATIRNLFPDDSQYWDNRKMRRETDKSLHQKLNALSALSQQQAIELVKIKHPCTQDLISALYHSAFQVDKNRFIMFERVFSLMIYGLFISTEFHALQAGAVTEHSTLVRKRLLGLREYDFVQIEDRRLLNREIDQVFQMAWENATDLGLREFENSVLRLILVYNPRQEPS